MIATLLTLSLHAGALDLVAPPPWVHHDLADAPALRLALGGARATLTYPLGGDGSVTVVVRRSKALARPWPTDVTHWTKELVGQRALILRTPTLRTRRGARVFTVEAQSDGTGGGQVYTALMAIEVTRDAETRLLLVSFEESAAEFHAHLPIVRRLFDDLRIDAS